MTERDELYQRLYESPYAVERAENGMLDYYEKDKDIVEKY